jgi:hypothetical protein
MSPHSNTFNQFLLFLLNAAGLSREATNTNRFDPNRGSNPRYTALEASTLAITPLMRFIIELKDEICNIIFLSVCCMDL